jgi:acetone carboxylase gamma subunit
MRIGDVVWTEDGKSVQCAHCKATISNADQNWKEYALVKRGNAALRLNNGEFGPTYRVYDNPHLELAEIFCPGCHALLSVELYLAGEPLRWAFRTLEAAAADGYNAKEDWRTNPERWISFGRKQ